MSGFVGLGGWSPGHHQRQNPGRSVVFLDAFGFGEWARMLQTFKFQRQGSFPSHTKKESHTLVMLKFTRSQ